MSELILLIVIAVLFTVTVFDYRRYKQRQRYWEEQDAIIDAALDQELTKDS